VNLTLFIFNDLFEERNVTSCFRWTLIYYILFICWENGVLHWWFDWIVRCWL